MSIQHAFVVPHPPIILPEVGRGEEQKISATTQAFQKISAEIARIRPQTVVVTSPHADAYSDFIAVLPGSRIQGDMSRFGAYGVNIRCEADEAFALALSAIAKRQDFPAGTLGSARTSPMDHGTLIPLYFINQHYTDYKLVVTGISGLSADDHYRFGGMVAQAARELGRSAVFIASGDLSHRLKANGPYGLHPDGPAFDREITQAVANADFPAILGMDKGFCQNAAECGLRSLQVMAGVFDGQPVESDLLSYEGPFGVGYAVASLRATTRPDARTPATATEIT